MIETPVPQGTTRISGIRTALIARALLMVTGGTARITQLRQIMRRDRASHGPTEPGGISP